MTWTGCAQRCWVSPSGQSLTDLLTSLPAYDLLPFTDNLSDGDLLDALGLPLAANTRMDTLFAGFALAVIDHAATQIAGDFSGLF